MTEESLSPKIDVHSVKRVGIICGSIAEHAEQLLSLQRQIVNEAQDPTKATELACISETLAEKIGWLADKTADLIPDAMVWKGDGTAEDWFLPPIYHKDEV